MRTLLLCAFIVLVSLLSLQAQETSQMTQVIIDNENSVWNALKDKDIEKFSSYFADDYIAISGMGIENKNKEIQLNKDADVQNFSLSDYKVVFPTNDVAIITYKVTGSETEKGNDSFMSSTWVKRNGKWLTLSHTQVPQTDQSSQQINAYWASPEDSVALKLIAMEKMLGAGNCSPQPGIEEIIADDFQGTAPDGIRYDKKEAMTPMNDRQCQLGDVKVHFWGSELAITYGNESSIRKGADGKENKRCLAWTDTWLKRNGKWQIIAAQTNVVECPK